jgi:hypothetical protein
MNGIAGCETIHGATGRPSERWRLTTYAVTTGENAVRVGNAVMAESLPSPPAITPQREAAMSCDAPARRRPRDVRDMSRPELEAHARELHLLPRALELPDDRLRANIQAFLAEMFDTAGGS